MSTFTRDSLLHEAEACGALLAMRRALAATGRDEAQAPHLLDMLRSPAMSDDETCEVLRGIAGREDFARMAVTMLSAGLKYERADAVLRSIGGRP